MLDYVAYSASIYDLTNWKYEGVIYKKSQERNATMKRNNLYAPDVVKGIDGRYYLYYCLEGFEGHAFYEGSSIRKINDTYYFIYSSMRNHELCYATSKKPDRDFIYRGTIISNGDVGYHGRLEKDRLNMTATNHGSIECINGAWYVFYHRNTHGSMCSRQACAEPIQIETDGTIHQVEMTSCGLNGKPLMGRGIYPAAIACNLSNGKMPHLMMNKTVSTIPQITHEGEERFITNIKNAAL